MTGLVLSLFGSVGVCGLGGASGIVEGEMEIKFCEHLSNLGGLNLIICD